MSVREGLEGRRVIRLIRGIKQAGALLPGDKVELFDEKPATYLGSFEAGDVQLDYVQLHSFRMHDGKTVILGIPGLNRWLCRLLY